MIDRKVTIEPSILSADYSRFGEQVREIESAGAKTIQIDIMDGHFVPNLTFGPSLVKALRPLVQMKFDVHLMMDNPNAFLQVFAESGADRLIVHYEVCPDILQTLQTIRTLGIEAGIAISPNTSVHVLSDILDKVDLIQVMTVQPGFGGQDFIFSQLEKIRTLRTMLTERQISPAIAVDGGIDDKTAPLVVAAGATVLVAGTAIFNQRGTIRENISRLLAVLHET
jgi:ribulose-phosphate 3-epimerase